MYFTSNINFISKSMCLKKFTSLKQSKGEEMVGKKRRERRKGKRRKAKRNFSGLLKMECKQIHLLTAGADTDDQNDEYHHDHNQADHQDLPSVLLEVKQIDSLTPCPEVAFLTAVQEKHVYESLLLFRRN